MEENISKIIEENKNNLEKVLYYSYNKFLENSYYIVLQKIMMTTKTLGVKAKQQVDAFTYSTPSVLVSSSYTSSRYINEFSRFYDDFNEIKAFNTSNLDDIKKGIVESKILTYDDYLSKFGKLFKGKYNVKKTNNVIDNFIDTYSYQNDSNTRYGIIIYEINDYSYKKAEIVKKGKNYLLTFILDPLVSHRFYSRQITSTGHLTADPTFTSSTITFLLNSELNLISANCKDNYKAKFGLLNLDIDSDTTYYFFTSNCKKFKANKKEISVDIPKENETNFLGFKLIK